MKNYKKNAQVNIRNIMRENKITLEDLAKALHYDSTATVSKHLNTEGKCQAIGNIEVMQEYAEALNVNVLDLMKEIKMDVSTYPVPDNKIEETMWEVYLTAVKQELTSQAVIHNVDLLAYETQESVFSDIADSMYKTSYIDVYTRMCLGFKEITHPDSAMNETENEYYSSNGKIWESDDLCDLVYEITEDYAIRVFKKELGLNEATYECAKMIYKTLLG